MDLFSFTSNESVVIATTPTTITSKENSSTTNVTIQWDLLAKKIEIFGNPKVSLPQLGHFMHLVHHLSHI
jgi:hypothetical protein